MPVNKKTTQENTKPDDVVVNSTTNDEIEQIKKENEELKSNINILMEQMTKLLEKQNTPETVSTTSTTDNVEDDGLEYPEPDANKQVRLVSMYYGSLTLCNSMNRNTARMLTFSKFGEIKSVLYHDLVDFVNNERKFAEAGYFYILDKAAVYHLGLSADYKKLVDVNFINNIMNYSDVEVHDIVSTMTTAQQDSLVEILADRMFNGQKMDMNKIDIISKITGKNIQNKVEEKKHFMGLAAKNG